MKLIQLRYFTRPCIQHFPKVHDVSNSNFAVTVVAGHGHRHFSCINAARTTNLFHHRHVQQTSARFVSDRPTYIDSDYFIYNEVVRWSQVYLEGVHDLFGVGWCTAIVLGVLPFRALVSVIMRRFQVNNQVEIVKIDEILAKYSKDLEKESETFEWRRKHKFLESKREVKRFCQGLVNEKKKELYQVRGASPAKNIVMGFLPLPQWVAFSMALRHEIGSPTVNTYFNIPWQWSLKYPDAVSPEMLTGGMLWFQNLTVCDPMFILPIITCGGFLLLNEVKTLLKPRQKKEDLSRLPMILRTRHFIMSSINNIVRCWCVLSLTIFWNAPAMTQFYWACSSIIALVTNLALMHSKVEINLLKKENREYALKHKVIEKDNYALIANNLRSMFKKGS